MQTTTLSPNRLPDDDGHLSPVSTKFEIVPVQEPIFEPITSGSCDDGDKKLEIPSQLGKPPKKTAVDRVANEPNQGTRVAAAEIRHHRRKQQVHDQEVTPSPSGVEALLPAEALGMTAVSFGVPETQYAQPFINYTQSQEAMHNRLLAKSCLLSGGFIIAVVAVRILLGKLSDPSAGLEEATLAPSPCQTLRSVSPMVQQTLVPFMVTSPPMPSVGSTAHPTTVPTSSPSSQMPSLVPTIDTTVMHSLYPSLTPTTDNPSSLPSNRPKTATPTTSPSIEPIIPMPSHVPTVWPKTSKPYQEPTISPTASRPSRRPTPRPTTARPSPRPTPVPTTPLTTLRPSAPPVSVEEFGKTYFSDVTSIDVQGMKWNGPIPSELGQWTKLTHLDLSGKELTGNIPSQLGLLTLLTALYLQENKLWGTIPSELGQLTALRTLYLKDNQLTGTIPTQLGQLTDMIDLSLSVNKLTGLIPTELGRLTALSILRLSDNLIFGVIPEELCSLGILGGIHTTCYRLDCDCGHPKCSCY